VYIRARNERAGDIKAKLRFFLHVLETAVNQIDQSAGVSQIAWIADFREYDKIYHSNNLRVFSLRAGQTSARMGLDVLHVSSICSRRF